MTPTLSEFITRNVIRMMRMNFDMLVFRAPSVQHLRHRGRAGNTVIDLVLLFRRSYYQKDYSNSVSGISNCIFFSNSYWNHSPTPSSSQCDSNSSTASNRLAHDFSFAQYFTESGVTLRLLTSVLPPALCAVCTDPTCDTSAILSGEGSESPR